ncbi:MAG: response regulator [Elusimicrobiota bacterium]|nr:MAG: response regulator [Elusimicrobiota bacterium]
MPARILIVEDESDLARVMAAWLAKRGRAFHHAPDAETAFRKFRRETHALVIIDVVLPGMSGLELLRIIRSESQVPVLMMSGSTSPAHRQQAMKLGAHAFLRKPFTPAALELAVRKALAFGVSV